MGVGFETYTEDGRLQFTTDASTYVLVGKGTFQVRNQYSYIDVSGEGGSGAGWAYIITLGNVITNYDFDFVAFRCSDGAILALPKTTPFGSPDPFFGRWIGATASQLSGDQPITGSSGTSSGSSFLTVEYWCFRSAKNVTVNDNFGLQIFDANSNLLYSAVTHKKPMSITSVVNINGVNTFTVPLPAGKSMAWMVASNDTGSGPLIQKSGNNLLVTNGSGFEYNILLVDVTGY